MAVSKHVNGEEIDRSVNAINYSEFVAKKKEGVGSVLLKILSIVVVVALAIIMFAAFGILALVIVMALGSVGVAALFYVVFPMFSTAHYYETESGLLTLQTRHGIVKEPMVSFRYSNCEIIAPYTPENTDKYEGFKGYTMHNFTTGEFPGDDYFAVYEDDKGVKHCVKFQCTSAILKIAKYYNKKATVSIDTLSR